MQKDFPESTQSFKLSSAYKHGEKVVVCSKEGGKTPHGMPSSLPGLRVEHSRVLKQKEIESSILGGFCTLGCA